MPRRTLTRLATTAVALCASLAALLPAATAAADPAPPASTTTPTASTTTPAGTAAPSTTAPATTAPGSTTTAPRDATPPTSEPPPTTHIVGGTPAADGEFPWAAGLFTDGVDAPAFCGATVISPSWVVTAAHCVVDPDDRPLPAAGVLVHTGSNDRTTGGQELEVARIFVHPGFTGIDNDYDVALLRLRRPTTSPPIRVTGVGGGDTALAAPGTDATIVGWGTTSESSGALQDSLRSTTVPIQDDGTCAAVFPEGREEGGYPLEYRAASMLCAGPMDGTSRDTCTGDSGGPLVVPDGSGWLLVGVTSWGAGCGRPNSPGVYHRLTSTTRWIGFNRRFGPFDPGGTAFVVQQYRDFVGRPPSPTELADGLRTVSGTPPATLIGQLAAGSAWDGNAGAVTRLYRTAFTRRPDTGGLTHWVASRWAGAKITAIADQLAASSEFRRTYGDLGDGAFVDQLYANVFGRPADPEGRAHWLGKLQRGAGRGSVLYGLSSSHELRVDRAAEVRVITTWFGLLRRVPTAAELDHHLAASPRRLIDDARTSVAYALRFAS